MKFKTIGAAWTRKSFKGTEYISITIDPDKFKKIYIEDYKKFCLFKNKFKDQPDQPDYTLCAPIPDQEAKNENT